MKLISVLLNLLDFHSFLILYIYIDREKKGNNVYKDYESSYESNKSIIWMQLKDFMQYDFIVIFSINIKDLFLGVMMFHLWQQL